jgi:hypothetical protein
MLPSYTLDNQHQWEASKAERLDEEARDRWLEEWAKLVGIKRELEDFENMPYNEVCALEEQEEGFITNFRKALSEEHDINGFLAAVDHPDDEIRVQAANNIDDVWKIDKELFRTAFVRLVRDDATAVRMFALQGLMIMLYGGGIESVGEPEDLEPADREGLQFLLAIAFKDINASVSPA